MNKTRFQQLGGAPLTNLKVQSFTAAGTIEIDKETGVTAVEFTLPASGTYALAIDDARGGGIGHLLKLKAAAQADGSPGTVTVAGLTFAVLAEAATLMWDGDRWITLFESIA